MRSRVNQLMFNFLNTYHPFDAQATVFNTALNRFGPVERHSCFERRFRCSHGFSASKQHHVRFAIS